MKNNNWTMTAVVAIIIGVLAFFGGMRYQQSKAASLNNGFANGTNAPGRRFGNGNGNNRAVTGEVVAQDANSITIKLQDGSSKIINISGTTNYAKTDKASLADVKTGERIAVFGINNSDGSVTAENIQLNAGNFRGGFGGGLNGTRQPTP